MLETQEQKKKQTIASKIRSSTKGGKKGTEKQESLKREQDLKSLFSNPISNSESGEVRIGTQRYAIFRTKDFCQTIYEAAKNIIYTQSSDSQTFFCSKCSTFSAESDSITCQKCGGKLKLRRSRKDRSLMDFKNRAGECSLLCVIGFNVSLFCFSSEDLSKISAFMLYAYGLGQGESLCNHFLTGHSEKTSTLLSNQMENLPFAMKMLGWGSLSFSSLSSLVESESNFWLLCKVSGAFESGIFRFFFLLLVLLLLLLAVFAEILCSRWSNGG